PGAAFWWRCPAIDTARAEDRDGNCGCWLHTPGADSHRLLGVARAHEASALLGNAASHLAGGQSLDQRNDLVSRAELRLVAHILVLEKGSRPLLRGQSDKQGQTRWCAWGSAQADDPVPDAGSTPIAKRSASTPAPRQHENTSDRGLVQHLHQPEQAQRR